MRTTIHLLSVIACVALLFGFAQLGAFRSLDLILADLRFALASKPASGKTLVIEIDSQSLAEIGVWPWPRHLYADILDRLIDDGAAEVAFDIDFSNPSVPADDLAFSQALERAGGYAYLAAFQQFSGSAAGLTLTLPHADFRQFADPVLVNVVLDQGGLAKAFPTYAQAPQGPIISLPVQFADPQRATPDMVNVDFGIDVDTIDRLSFADVVAGRVDPAVIKDRQVIVGASAVELRDFFQIPRFGIISGPMFQALSVETLLANRAIINLGAIPAAIAALLVGLAVLALRSRVSIATLVAGCLFAVLAWELAAFLSYLELAILMSSSVFHLSMLVFLGLAVADEARVQYQGRATALRRLAYLATNDPTTGSLTRQGFLDALETGPDVAAIGLIRINRMNILRASLGHELANQTLAAVAHHLASCDLGLIAYVAPDTFAFTVPQGGPDGAEAICVRLSQELARTYQVERQSVHVEVVCAYAAGSDAPGTLLNHAEIALITAPSTATGVGAFIAADAAALSRRRLLDIDLRSALGNGQLWVAYQPLVDLVTRRILGAEALLRWQHPELGNIPPDQFIPLAEETGLIVDLGAWILHRACQASASWNWDGRISVNVSPVQMALSDLPETVRTALRTSGLSAGRLKLEVTESSLLNGAARTLAVFSALAKMGVGVALDDFGTGYSSLSYLKDLPFEILKVDQSFVRNMDGDSAGATIVAAIVALARNLGKGTVAEGIEHEHQAVALRDLGCDLGQGYLFARPMSEADMQSLLAQEHATIN